MNSMAYYPAQSVYRQQQIASPNAAHFQPNSTMHSWYGGYHQSPQLPTATPTGYCVQEDQQIWHAHSAHLAHPAHGVYHDFQEFAIPPGVTQIQQPQNQIDPENQLPSPPITVSGSDISSPGAQSSPNESQNTRPPPARSPYEWIRKTSYQSQPNPGKTRTKDKYRVVYTDHQRIELEKEFTFNNKYITIRRKTELSNTLGLSERQIKIWFQNRRAKERKLSKKRFEEKTQIDLINSPYHQQNIINQHSQISHLDLHNQQTILPNIVPPSTSALQRYMGNNHSVKLENSENTPLSS